MAGPESQPEVLSQEDVNIQKMGGFMPEKKAEGTSGGAEDKEQNEALQKKARDMLGKKLTGAVKHVMNDPEVKDLIDEYKNEGAVREKDLKMVYAKLKMAGTDFINGLLNDPNFPGVEHLVYSDGERSGAYSERGLLKLGNIACGIDAEANDSGGITITTPK